MGVEARAALATLLAFVAAVVLLPLGARREFEPLEIELTPHTSRLPRMHADTMAAQVSKLVQLNTISDQGLPPSHLPPASQRNMKEAHALLRSFYPHLFAAATVETVNEFSLLLTLPGSDSSERPALFMCHLDVVAIEDGTESEWGRAAGCSHCGPFSGAIHEGYVWGRGSLDMKQYCVAMLYAAERLLSQDRGGGGGDDAKLPPFRSARPIMCALGHDEEAGGQAGHAQIVQHLKSKGMLDLEFVHDEGLPIIPKGSSPQQHFDWALVGLAEKGYLSVRVTCNGTGGHGSSPPSSGTAI